MAPPKSRIIIDTDPGVDDVLAMLLALSASPDELEILLISVTYGNIPVQRCLRNVVALFHVIEKELVWRKSQGKPEGFEALKAHKPIVAAGPEHPLQETELLSDNFHGLDGLHFVHDHLPHLTPADTWASLFQEDTDGVNTAADADAYSSPLFTPSKAPSHKEILRLLRENPPDTISILAVGPLTNVAIAAAEDPETFLRAREVVVMGGAVHCPGNVTPLGEFNALADPVAAARVYALTSPMPISTMPPIPPEVSSVAAYPDKLSRQLRLVLCPLDITTPHEMSRAFFTQHVEPLISTGSPLAQWTAHFINGAFDTIQRMVGEGTEPVLSLHDPFTVWYAMARDDPKFKFAPQPEDIRVETAGQWTRGMHVIDKRGFVNAKEAEVEAAPGTDQAAENATLEDLAGDESSWTSATKGNRIARLISSPGEELFKEIIMQKVFGL